jgi:predicted dienelactone hydrolase
MVHAIKLLFTILVCTWIFACASLQTDKASLTIPDGASGNGNLMVDTLEFPDLVDSARNGRKVPIKVHFPKNSAGPFPVIVVSHGAGGNWDTHYAQAQHLASHGYVVLCVEHTGSNTKRMKRNVRWIKNLTEMVHDASEVLGRPKDVSFAIDRAEEWNRTHPQLRGMFDLDHVAVMGHSFGAFTALVVSGARPALEWIEPRVAPGKGIGPDLRDKRVKCSVALSPQGAGKPFFHPESFGFLQIPVLGISGTRDNELSGNRPPENRYQAFSLWPTAQGKNIFVWLANAHHIDFADSRGAHRYELPSRTRNDVQIVVKATTLLFFNFHLKGDAAAGQQLSTQGLTPYLHGSIDFVSVRAK